MLVTPPTADLVHSLRESELDNDSVLLENWPDVDLIFDEDPDYQTLLKSLIALVKKELNRVRTFSEVNTTYSMYRSKTEHKHLLPADFSCAVFVTDWERLSNMQHWIM